MHCPLWSSSHRRRRRHGRHRHGRHRYGRHRYERYRRHHHLVTSLGAAMAIDEDGAAAENFVPQTLPRRTDPSSSSSGVGNIQSGSQVLPGQQQSQLLAGQAHCRQDLCLLDSLSPIIGIPLPQAFCSALSPRLPLRGHQRVMEKLALPLRRVRRLPFQAHQVKTGAVYCSRQSPAVTRRTAGNWTYRHRRQAYCQRCHRLYRTQPRR